MENVKKYFRKEFQLEMFSLKHDNTSDFVISCWQRNLSSLPLLFLRTLIFIGCVGILVSSMVITTKSLSLGMWFIFMTHWGLLLMTATSGFAVAVSLVAFFQGPLGKTGKRSYSTHRTRLEGLLVDEGKGHMKVVLPMSHDYSSLGLPWYVKIYWILFNTTISIAFYITIFYWTFLTSAAEDYGIDPVLDVFIHAINSVLMLTLLLISRHPTRLMHFYFPLALSIIYMLFSIIFYYAGGISPFGTSWIYPMLDWSKPVATTLTVFASAFMFIVIHAIVVAITVGRDAVTKRFRNTTVLTISNDRYN